MSLASQVSVFATRVATEFKSVRTALGLKAPLASPALTGVPTAPTAAATDSSTTLATTAFAAAAASSAGAGAAGPDLIPNRYFLNAGAGWGKGGAAWTFAPDSGGTINRAVITTTAAEIDLYVGTGPTSVIPAKKSAWYTASIELGLDSANTVTPTAGAVSFLITFRDALSNQVGQISTFTQLTTLTKTRALQTVLGQAPATAVSVSIQIAVSASTPTGVILNIANPSLIERVSSNGLAPDIALTGAPTAPDAAAAATDTTIANTGWVARLTGVAADWAGQLNAGLTAPTSALAASKTVPGIIQLGTAAEAATGTDDAHAVTAASIAALLASAPVKQVYRVSSLAALNALASTAQQGSLATIMNIPIGSNGASLSTSIWMLLNGTWYVATQMYGGNNGGTDFVANAAAAADIFAAITAQPKLAIPNGMSLFLSYKFVCNGAKFVLSSGTTVPGYPTLFGDWDPANAPAGWHSSLTREGRHVTARFGIRRTDANTISGGMQVSTIPDGFRPVANQSFTGASYTSYWTGSVSMEVSPAGVVLCDWFSATTALGVFASTTWEAAD